MGVHRVPPATNVVRPQVPGPGIEQSVHPSERRRFDLAQRASGRRLPWTGVKSRYWWGLATWERRMQKRLIGLNSRTPATSYGAWCALSALRRTTDNRPDEPDSSAWAVS
jgi:hypothetical protein